MKPALICKGKNRRKCHNIPGSMFGPFSFINVSSGNEAIDAENGMKNMVEVAVALRILHLKVECMQQKLENHYPITNEFFTVKTGLVHNYQGGEVDVMIISTVGPSDGDEYNELSRSQNVNSEVYLAWARNCLWILVDERLHLKGGSIWESLILDAKARNCFIQADEHKDLAKVIVEVKQDLHQLDELLSSESTLFRSTTWKVLFSSMFRTSFSKIDSWETKKVVLLMLLKLSSGWRPKRSSTAVFVSKSTYSEVIKEFKVRGLHLICTIDIEKKTCYTQVLKVWDILSFHEIGDLVKRLEGIIGTYPREYIDCCKAKCNRSGFEFPITWPVASEIHQYMTQANHRDENFTDGANGNGCVENVKVRESLILMKFYSLSTRAVNYIIYGCDGGDLDIPFELPEQEKNVVSFDKSSFILGRSGTGKTTVLTMKLFQNEQLHHLACEGFHEVNERNKEAKQDVLHQLFVTFSPKLCYAVKQQVDAWKRSTCGGSSSSRSSLTSIDNVNEMMISEDIPNHFIHLPNDAYPLIITLHRFLLMLDGTVGTSYFDRFPSVRHLLCGNQTSSSRLVALEKHMRSKDVTYERFCSIYWPHFNNKLTKKFDPSTVYTEIMSVIKGGITSCKAFNGILSKVDYVTLSDGRTSILDSQKREDIYSIFLQYEKKKVENGNFDLADLVNDLHQRLEVEGYKGDIMDYVYIDEVQDLSMRQIMLFKYVCTNVHEGFAFSGDTAQAIAKGIGFRFEDIRCLFFNKFLLASEKGKLSKMFHLSENFRTHAGVLNLAQSVINLLCHFFPLFVDALSPETSRIGGELPILLETDINNNAIKFIFERGGNSSQQIHGFGAEQVVLVRDESHKEKIVEIVGKNAIVLTIMESKGLEFQDVLLYDFFTTSSFSNEWRIIYEYMNDKNLLISPSTALCSCFDIQKHAVLCSELKQLYVAITRTRQRLWICETTGFSQPIYDYWKKLSLVNVEHLSDSFADNMHISSSETEWQSRGIKLFYENNFRMARMCFLKAGDKYSEILAEAYHLRAMADDARFSQLERKTCFKDAAELFSSIGKKELAAECFYEIEDYRTAGEIYKSNSMLEKAGDCFHLAKCYELAVEEYEKAGAFAKCLCACGDGNLFKTGFELLGRWGGCEHAELEFLRKGANYYFSVKDFESMMKFVRSFCDKGEMRSFLTNKRCFDELILLEKEWGNFEEAAKVARLKPDSVLEADLLHTGGLHKESSLIILWHVFFNSPIFQSADEPFTREELLRKAVQMAESDSDVFCQFIRKEARILSEGESREELLKKGLEFIYCYKENDLSMLMERVKTTHEIEKIEKLVLNLTHSFFKSVNRLLEFVLLLETLGKFVEAAKIGNEDDHSIEAKRQAAFTRLWYAFFGSLWAHGARAWPLKGFKQKHKLLDDANSYVKDHHDSEDSVLVSTEISVLSGDEISLIQMWRYLTETPRERSLRVHFIISRRILDVHLCLHIMVDDSIDTEVEDEKIKSIESVFLKDTVSVESLIYFWSYWKELILELMNWSRTIGQGCNTTKTYEDFIFNYFGVRRYDGGTNGSYVVLNAKAQWVKEMNPFMLRKGYLHIISAREFTYAASWHWCSELLFVAEKVLKKLQSLHAYSTVKIFSMLKQTKILASLFEVAKSLQKCNFLLNSVRASRIADQAFQFCVDPFLSNVFHIDWKIAQSKEMISLRGNGTFLNMLEEAMNINRKIRKDLMCGHLGRMVMIALGSKMICFYDDTMKKIRGCSSQNWINLFSKLTGDSRNGDLAISLHNVLKETFSASWSTDNEFMSPACFIYLLERLLILSFCFRGYIFTTRSCFVEWLSYEEQDMVSVVSHVTSVDTMKKIHESLASMVSEMLNSPDDLMHWLTRSKEPESLYPILVLRLTVLLSLICVNSRRHYYHLLHLLGHSYLVSLLPSAFREALIKGINEDCLVDAVAIACEKIDNPLVIASFTKDFSEAPCQKAIFLNMTELEFSREKLVEMLYQGSEFPLLSTS